MNRIINTIQIVSFVFMLAGFAEIIYAISQSENYLVVNDSVRLNDFIVGLVHMVVFGWICLLANIFEIKYLTK
jgi:hypothetical protein